VFHEGALLPFIIAGIFVALPIIGLTVYIDTLYYLGVVDWENWVFTAYNFVKVNLIESLSEYFGTDPFWDYFTKKGPAIFTLMSPVVCISGVTHYITKRNRNESPYMTYYAAFYFVFFSAIPHKELRFLIPIVPFAFVMAGELAAQTIKRGGDLATFTSIGIKLFVVFEVI